MNSLQLGALRLETPAVMGILNVTPDSFSDGGRFDNLDSARRQAERMAAEGAAIIDIGGESTRPGARGVDAQQEIDRVVPAIESVRGVCDVAVSIDTSKPEVMRAAVAAGAVMINDVRALRVEGALQTAADLNLPVCLMHMQGEPRSMQDQPHYDNVVTDVASFLESRVAACVEAGLDERLIVVDPGFGFGKTLEHNIQLLGNLRQLRARGWPMLVGVSRKSMIGQLLDIPVSQRMPASVALAGLAVWLGAAIIRAHDVQPTVHAVKMCQAIKTTT